MTFSNFGGGLVNTVVAGAGNSISAGLSNQLTSNIQFSVSDVLANAVQDTSGYVLDAGQNYLLSQLGNALPSNISNSLGNAVISQIASVGLNAVRGFASSGIENLLPGSVSSILPSLGGMTVGATNGFIGLHADGLPDADYGGQRFTVEDIVFSIVPSNAGPQTQPQPQSAPTLPLNYAFDPSFSNNIPGLDALKGKLSVAGPGSGIDFSGSFSQGAAATPSVSYSSLSSIKPLW